MLLYKICFYFLFWLSFNTDLFLNSCTDERVLRLAWSSIGLWVLAISCWLSDRFGCSFWQKLNFCYLHGIWWVSHDIPLNLKAYKVIFIKQNSKAVYCFIRLYRVKPQHHAYPDTVFSTSLFRHILIVVATAYASTLIAYLDASLEIPHSLPDLQYWPQNNWSVGLPYIVLKGSTKTRKRC